MFSNPFIVRIDCIINLSNKVFLFKRFNYIIICSTNLNRVIIVKHDGVELGILADEITGNINININDLQSKTSTITKVENDFIIGITNDRLVVIDIKEFLLNDKLIINEEV